MGLALCYHAVSDTWRHPLSVPEHEFERQVRSVARRRPHVTFDDAYTSVAAACALLRGLDIPATIFVITSCAVSGDPPADHSGDAGARTLAWNELRGLADDGVEVGSHSVTHPDLTSLGDDELLRELVDSRRQIEDELARPCRSLAYPYGATDERVQRAAARAGYERAYRAKAWRPQPLALPRASIFRHDGRLRFFLKTAFVRP